MATLIEQQLSSFLANTLRDHRIDLVVCGERKGTAVLRALIESATSRLEWSWHKVISTASIAAVGPEFFDGRRVLVFDELVHHGNALKRAKAIVSERSGGRCECLLTAGFAVWERCEIQPDLYYFGAVDSETYFEIRDSVVRLLQSHGSLLLDTEHLEITATLNCSVREFYGALGKAVGPSGSVHSFPSSAGRLALTVNNPVVVDPRRLRSLLPPKSVTDGVVQKCRVIERDHDRFAIMPIIYPSIENRSMGGWVAPSWASEAGAPSGAVREEAFYLVALFASVELLKGVISALGDLIRQGKVSVELVEADLEHLRAIFPRLRLEKFGTYIRDVIADAKIARLGDHGLTSAVKGVSEETVRAVSYHTLADLLRDIDEFDGSSSLRGRTWSQLVHAGSMRYERPSDNVSLAVDRLIDSGLLVTDVEKVETEGRETWFIRTFRPDGEVVADRFRNHLAVVGRTWQPTPLALLEGLDDKPDVVNGVV